MRLRVELAVADLDASAGFYVDALGFTLVGDGAEYRSLERGVVVLGLRPWPADLRRDATGRGGAAELVLEVDGGPDAVDALHRRVVAAQAHLTAPPADQPGGRHDFTLTDPDGHAWRVTHAGEDAALARTPPPPYTAVIFTSVRGDDDHAGYAVTAAAMEALAAKQPGYLGIESARSDLGITVSYWASAADARAWKAVAEHEVAQRAGQQRWYRHYRIRVATVERDYGI